MLDQRAETSFERGLEELRFRSARDALPFFRAAMELDRRKAQARYVSYYGLCLSFSEGQTHEAIQRCRRAAEMESYRPELWWNLGRVALSAGRRGEAHRAFHRGLAVHPGHSGIVRELRRMGLRRAPVLPFLARGNPINVLLGRLRAAPHQSGRARHRTLATG